MLARPAKPKLVKLAKGLFAPGREPNSRSGAVNDSHSGDPGCRPDRRFARSGLQIVRPHLGWRRLLTARVLARARQPTGIHAGAAASVPTAAASSPATARPLVMRPVSTSLTACGSGTQRDQSSLSSSGLAAACSSACSCSAWYTRHISVLIPGDGRRSASVRGPRPAAEPPRPAPAARRRGAAHRTYRTAPRAAPADSARPGDGTAGSAVPLPVIDRHDRHRAHVLDHLTLGPGPVWLDHGVDADLDERAVIFQSAPDYLIAY